MHARRDLIIRPEQVGGLYPPEDEARRTHGYVLFSTGINVGGVIGPVLCGLLAQLYGWHYGFGIAAPSC